MALLRVSVLCLPLGLLLAAGTNQCSRVQETEAAIAAAIVTEAHPGWEIETGRHETEAHYHRSEGVTTHSATTPVALLRAIDRTFLQPQKPLRPH